MTENRLKKAIGRIAILKDRFSMVVFALTLLLALAQLLVLIFLGPQGSMPTALHYNVYVGIDTFNEPINLLWIPVVGLIIFVINLVLGLLIYTRSKYLTYWLGISALLTQIILLVSIFLLIIFL
ncbi:hypothetical protein ACFL1U_02510 [Patescibacteria group bacterium]